MHEARYYEKRDKQIVQCHLCPHQCVIKPGRRGICKVRENREGTLWALAYGRAVALHHDPIEKKPLFHVLPGSISTSVATAGCNLSCEHCQNFEISQLPARTGNIPGREIAPAAVAEEALGVGARTIALTYTEPTIFMEWAQDIAAAAAGRGIGCVSVTNGYTSEEPLRDLGAHLLAANVDLKAFDERFYKRVCGAHLEPVLDSIRLLRELGVWVEVTTLLIPGFNDDDAQLEALAGFLVEVDADMPWHLSRFHPDNQMLDAQPTPIETIRRARRIGLCAGVHYVYSGNVWGDEGEHTRCPACGALVIERRGFSVLENHLEDGRCPECRGAIAGVWA